MRFYNRQPGLGALRKLSALFGDRSTHRQSWDTATVEETDDPLAPYQTADRPDFAWRDPPTRSTTEYHSEIGGSIQDALNSISFDTELILDDGPYSETADLPSTSSITVSGGSDGADWNNPGSARVLLDDAGWSRDTTSCDAISAGDTTLSVGDASIFTAGDDMQIQDPSTLYQGMSSDVLNETHSQYKGELKIVESVDTSNDTITLTSGTHQGYDGSVEASAITWGMTDVHVTNIEFDGGVHSGWAAYSGDEMYGISVGGFRDFWATNITGGGFHGDLITLSTARNGYVDNCHVNDIGRYGISFQNGHRHGRAQNCTAGYIDKEDSGYLIMSGGGAEGNESLPKPTYDIQARACGPVETGNWLYEAHFGAEAVYYMNGQLSSGDCNPCKLRGTDQHLIGGTYDPIRGWSMQMNQVLRQDSIEEVFISGGSYGMIFWPKEGHPVVDPVMKDCQFENMDKDPFYFRSTNAGNPPPVENLRCINSSWNGEWIDQARIEDSYQYDSSAVDIGEVSYPTDQTPAEYFG